MFSKHVGIIASLFYSTSPLIIFNARMPYHTSLIPSFTLIWFYTLYKWIKGYKYGFPMLIFILAILYNFELSMIMLAPIILIILIYGLIEKTSWAKSTITPKILFLSFLGLLIPMIPMILYDIHHGYPQTIKFGIWIVYKIANFIHIPLAHPDIPGETYQSMFTFASIRIPILIFSQSALVSWSILLISFLNLLVVTVNLFRKGKFVQPYLLLLFLFGIPFLFYIAEKTNSDAYWPIFFPTFAFMFALLFDKLLSFTKFFAVLLALIILINIWTYLQPSYNAKINSITLPERIQAAEQIVRQSNGRSYNLIANGPGERYENFTTGYAYLTWWLGNGPSISSRKLRFYITEQGQQIIVQKRN
jgi:hypothetical protein